MSQAKAVSREKEKGVELKDVENIERPRPTSTRSLLTLKPLPKIDPKDKGKKKIEEDESDTKSEDINEYAKDRLRCSAHVSRDCKKGTKWIGKQKKKTRAAALEPDHLQESARESDDDSYNMFDESFTVIGSNKDERKVKELNEGASDPDKKKKFIKEDVLTKVHAKPDVAKQGTKKRKGGHMKMLARKRKRPQSNVYSDDEHRKYLKIVTFEEAMGNFQAFNYLLEVTSYLELQRFISLIMMESSKEENDQSDFWNDQQNWEIVTWRLYEARGVYILELEDGTVIHCCVERRYHLSKDLMQRMFDFGLEVEIERHRLLVLAVVLVDGNSLKSTCEHFYLVPRTETIPDSLQVRSIDWLATSMSLLFAWKDDPICEQSKFSGRSSGSANEFMGSSLPGSSNFHFFSILPVIVECESSGFIRLLGSSGFSYLNLCGRLLRPRISSVRSALLFSYRWFIGPSCFVFLLPKDGKELTFSGREALGDP
ncbi:hypothetical protein Tco_0185646 [Tanacetum coccineum]